MARTYKVPVALHTYERKLNEAQVRDIRSKEKKSKEYVEKYKLSRMQVWRIQNNKSYTWVQ